MNSHLENVEYFNYFGITGTNAAKCTRDIKPRLAMAAPEFK
jgi:hypothetical protein